MDTAVVQGWAVSRETGSLDSQLTKISCENLLDTHACCHESNRPGFPGRFSCCSSNQVGTPTLPHGAFAEDDAAGCRTLVAKAHRVGVHQGHAERPARTIRAIHATAVEHPGMHQHRFPGLQQQRRAPGILVVVARHSGVRNPLA